jgi:hypothetical protein
MGLIPGTRNFWTSEVRCHYTGILPPEELYLPVALKLQQLRDMINIGRERSQEIPIVVRSWYRDRDHPLSLDHRRKYGRASQHETGQAVDVWIPGFSEEETFTMLCLIFNGVGYYPCQRSTHGDMRDERVYWKRDPQGNYSNINPSDYWGQIFYPLDSTILRNAG